MSNRKQRRTARSRSPRTSKQPVMVRDDAERAAAEAAIRAVREGRKAFRQAVDPTSSMEAYAKVYEGSDAMTQLILETLEEEEDEEPDSVVVDGIEWREVITSPATYRTLRGPVRVTRKLYRAERNGPTRCFYEERRGVMPGQFMPDLGRVIVETVAEIPATRACAVLERATGQALSSATMKRTTAAVGNALKDEEERFFDDRIRRHRVPREARAVVISVDGLSFNLRGEGYKQATAATITLVNDEGDRLQTIKLAEMPEEGKRTIMERVEREVRAILRKRPDLTTQVVIDGAPDLRAHLAQRFPDAVHITDFFHVVEHIAEALRAIFPKSERLRRAIRSHLCHILKHEDDGAKRVLAWLRDPLAALRVEPNAAVRRAVEPHLNYIEGQMPYLGYAEAANDNLALGSGVCEAACKTLVTQRMKISGAKWSRPGARAVLYLRSLAQSGRLNEALDFHQSEQLKWAA